MYTRLHNKRVNWWHAIWISFFVFGRGFHNDKFYFYETRKTTFSFYSNCFSLLLFTLYFGGQTKYSFMEEAIVVGYLYFFVYECMWECVFVCLYIEKNNIFWTLNLSSLYILILGSIKLCCCYALQWQQVNQIS